MQTFISNADFFSYTHWEQENKHTAEQEKKKPMLIKYSFQNTRVCKDSGGEGALISALMNLSAQLF